MSSELLPEIDSNSQPYWDALRDGVLKFQSCECGHNWLPPRRMCPACLSSQWQWQASTGAGTIKSWVVFHTAYHPEFKDRIPYNVAIVRLKEGPQLIANILSPNEDLKIGASVALCVDKKLAQPLAHFKLEELAAKSQALPFD